MRRASDLGSSRGFTLVEMIIAIVITGILIGIVGMFGRRQIDAYMDVGNRAELADAADTALRRIARDLQAALPNSVRQPTNNNRMIEYVPVRDAGRYRADVGISASDDPLSFGDASDTTFEVLGPSVTLSNGDQLVVFNLGQPGSDVYASGSGSSRRAATAGTALNKVTFAPAGNPFTLASPQSRFQIVGGPVTYECAPNAANPELGQVIRHWCYDFQATQPTVFGSLAKHAACTAEQSAILVSDVEFCEFRYQPGVLQRNGLVVLHLKLTRNSESVDLLHQVEVLNTP